MFEQEHQLAIEAARAAGKLALAYEGRLAEVKFKGGDRENPVTAADKELDAYLKETLMGAYPDYGWLSEETEDNGDWLAKESAWVVDPIDGTKGFIQWMQDGMPREPAAALRRQFSISIALLYKGQPVVGVVYAPLCAQMISAVKGQGVFVNGQISERGSAPSSLTETVYLSSVSETKSGALDFLQGEIDMRPCGSVAYKLALTAVDAKYVTGSVKPKNVWDVAAGVLICAEAEVTVTDLHGQTYDFTKAEEVAGVVAGPVALYPDLLALLNKKSA